MFNDKYGLTKAVLARRKTQTRRLIPKEFFSLQWDIREDTLVVENDYGEFIDIRNTKYCMLEVGEIVAVAQSYKDIFSAFSQYHNPQLNISVKNPSDTAGWNNKMFVKAEAMPHQIRITNVRIEHLQDISDNDCLKEGVYAKSIRCSPTSKGADKVVYEFYNSKHYYSTPKEAYAALIDKVGKKGDWESNPYVFVYEFELVK